MPQLPRRCVCASSGRRILSTWRRLMLIGGLFLIGAFGGNEAEDGWFSLRRGSFPQIVSIRGRFREHACTGVLVHRTFILTSAFCIEEVGPNAIVVISPFAIYDDRRTEGVQEARVDMTYVHPGWTGNVESGYDAALLRLPQEILIPTPKLASQSFNLYPNYKTFTFWLGAELKAAQFDVVDNQLCPHVANLSAAMFCAYSDAASMQPGDSGSPVIVPKSSMANPQESHFDMQYPNDALIVGIVSYANFSELHESGAVGVLISAIRNWIDVIIPEQTTSSKGNYFPAGLLFLILIPLSLVIACALPIGPQPEHMLQRVIKDVENIRLMDMMYNMNIMQFLQQKISRLQHFPLEMPRGASIREWREDVKKLTQELEQALCVMRAHSTLDIHNICKTVDAKLQAEEACEAMSRFLSNWHLNGPLNGYEQVPEVYVEKDRMSLKQRIEYVLGGEAHSACESHDPTECCWEPIKEDWERFRQEFKKCEGKDKQELAECLQHVVDDGSSGFQY